MFMGFYEKLIFAIGKRMFAISPDRIGEKSDLNHGMERLTPYNYFPMCKGKMCQTKQKNTAVTTKQ